MNNLQRENHYVEDLLTNYTKVFNNIRVNNLEKDKLMEVLTTVSNETNLRYRELKEIELEGFKHLLTESVVFTSDLLAPSREHYFNLLSQKSVIASIQYGRIKDLLLDKYFINNRNYSKFDFTDDEEVNLAVIPIPKIDVNIENISSVKFYYNFILIIKSTTSVLWIEIPSPIYMSLHSLQRILCDRFTDITVDVVFESIYNSSLLFEDFLDDVSSPFELVIPIGKGLAYGNKDLDNVNYCSYNYFNYDFKTDTNTELSEYFTINTNSMIITTCVDRSLMNYKQISLSNRLIKLFNEKPENFNEEYNNIHNTFSNRYNAIRLDKHQ